jgi:FMN phosphatase YigB (HAD superfamily)
MIRAIIFDCFGVLCADGWLPFKKAHFSADPALWGQASALNVQCDAGEITYPDFIQQIAELSGVSPEQVDAELTHNPTDDALFKYIAEELHGTYKLGILSNAGENWLERIFTPDQLALFDATLLSHEIGVTKPHPNMYHTIAERLGTQPAECLFVDDQPKYITGAKSVGMRTLAYTDFAQFRSELETLLADS